MSDLQLDQSLHTIYGYSTQEQAFINAIAKRVKPFYLAIDQVDEVLNQYIGETGNISYTLNPINEQAETQPLTGPLNCNGKRVENIGVVPDLTSIESILASGSTAVNVNTMSTFVGLFSALNLIIANPLLQTTVGLKNLRPVNVADGQIPIISDIPEDVVTKNKGLLTTGQIIDHAPTDMMKIRDVLDTEQPNRPFFDCDDRVMQRALDPIVNQDLVTLKFFKDISLNRGNISNLDFDANTRQISSLLEPEEVKETMNQIQKDLQDKRAINQKFMRDTALSRLNVTREEPPGVFSYNEVFDAKGRAIQNLGFATKNNDALRLKQAVDKFLAYDGETINLNNKRAINGLEAVDDYDIVVYKQLKETETELQDLIDHLGGGSGGSLLDIISLIASLTSLGVSLASLGLKAGTALSSIGQVGGSLLSGVLALASILKNEAGQVIGNTAQKIANGTSLNDYSPDPNNFVESQADLDRLRDGARNVEQANALPANSVGGSWLNGPFQAPVMMQRQMFNAFEILG